MLLHSDGTIICDRCFADRGLEVDAIARIAYGRNHHFHEDVCESCLQDLEDAEVERLEIEERY